jgi:hypothetical protein
MFTTQPLLPWNETTTLAYTSVRTAGNVSATIPELGWSRYSLGTKEAAKSLGVYLASDEKITFALGALAFEPKPGDKVTPAGLAERVVLTVTRNPMLRFWDLIVRDLILAHDLRSVCTIKRSAPTPGTGGLRATTFTDLAEDVPCKLNWDRTAFEPETTGKMLAREQYTLWLGQRIQTLPGDLVEVDGTAYEVTEPIGFALDGLAEVRCTRIQ